MLRLGTGLGIGVSVVGSPGEAPAPPTSLTLDESPFDGGLVQGSFGSLTSRLVLSGTYGGGTPSGIQARLVRTGDEAVTLDWTSLTSTTIGGGTYTGTLSGLPATPVANGTVRVEVRATNATSVTAVGSGELWVGDLFPGIGQSNMGGLLRTTSSPDAAATGTVFYESDTGWGTVAVGNGIRKMLNAIVAATGYPAASLDASEGGQNLDYFVNGDGWDDFSDQLTAAGGRCRGVVFAQGEGDANSGATDRTVWKPLLSDLCDQINTLVGEDVPLFLGGLATTTVGGNTTDETWAEITIGQLEAPDEIDTVRFSHTARDAARTDEYHYTAASQGDLGLRFAQSILVELGEETGMPNWSLSGTGDVIDATTVEMDVSFTGSLGTDYTVPSGAEVWFEQSGDGGATWEDCTSVSRVSASRIELVCTGPLATSSARKVRFANRRDGSLDVADLPYDNSTLAVPLSPSKGVLSPTPLAATPVPTYRSTNSSPSYPDGTHTLHSGFGIGTAAATRLVMGVVTMGSSGETPTVVEIEVSGESTVTATIVIANNRTAIFQGVVPAGTTCDVRMTFPGGVYSDPIMSVWTIDTGDMNSTTALDSDSAAFTGGTGATVSLTTAADGFILAGAVQFDTGVQAASISGDATYTERRDNVNGGARHVHADASGTDAQTNANAVTATFANTGDGRITAASWR